tara:strand:+ start:1900 stop:2661 length:762 start_codon:yes stop_codon:yes gene_type:complete
MSLITEVKIVIAAGLIVLGLAATGSYASESDRNFASYDDSSDIELPVEEQGNSLVSLFYELQILRQELKYLRGAVEEQRYALDRLTKSQQDQYIDLDKRILKLTKPSRVSQEREGDSVGLEQGPEEIEPGSEREDYAQAFKLAQDEEIDQAIISFNQLIADYPDGDLIPNAFYWLGQLYFIRMEYEKARQSFMQILNVYSSHSKMPDTLYKLGITYDRLGDSNRCIQLLERVQDDFPRSPAAGLAKAYMIELE